MDKEYVPYNIALKLLDKGFDDITCSAFYKGNKLVKSIEKGGFLKSSFQHQFYNQTEVQYHNGDCLAPLWQQVFDWLRKDHKFHIEIFLSDNRPYNTFHYRVTQIGQYFTLTYDSFEGTYEEVRVKVIEKIIDENL